MVKNTGLGSNSVSLTSPAITDTFFNFSVPQISYLHGTVIVMKTKQVNTGETLSYFQLVLATKDCPLWLRIKLR